ncbi:hypothetical protein EAI30_03515 [Romboutsia ilealis]|uniref:Uncharacterized protein n=1 Tax=Romboutsia faecis TaxID=2764597 RepID=A0ABR7JKM5_9FIRM|nr:hypothetical protein [Romboutsia faecis]MBC5995478.1 hypothetical protein [Romboutsia faecis]MRN23680.1 hypothetical protein [Romboutsia ilealis]
MKMLDRVSIKEVNYKSFSQYNDNKRENVIERVEVHASIDNIQNIRMIFNTDTVLTLDELKELVSKEIEDKCSEDINDNESIDEINVKMSFDASRYVNNSKFEKVSDSGEYDNKYTPIEKIKRIYESIFK